VNGSGSAPNVSALARALVARAIDELELPRSGRIVIAVAGESGSGKSVTAIALSQQLTSAGIPATVLHQDDYFLLPPRTNHEHRVLDLGNVGPHEVNLALLQSHVDAFRAERDGVEGPAVDYPANRFATQRHDFSRFGALIVEGTYVFRLRDIDLRIFLEATHHDTRERRRVRNRDIDAPIIDQVLALEHDLIAPQAAQANILIDRDFAIRPGR
jgi:uridine kinase